MSRSQAGEHRYGELDALRGVAVLMMMAYHLAFDLEYFYGWDIGVLEGGWWLLARATATLFLLLIGVCFMISWERTRVVSGQYTEQPFAAAVASKYTKYLRRGVTILSGGMVISLVTSFVAPDAFVKFGILHLIGVSALLQPFFAPFGAWNALIGAVIVVGGTTWAPHVAPLQTIWGYLFFPLGFPYSGFASLDYYPLFPWFGFILIGMAMGSLLYVPDRRRILAPLSLFPFPISLLWTGRRALILYFLHQPILLLLLRLTLGPALRIHLR